MSPSELPFEMKKQLHDLSEIFPKKSRPIFLRETGKGIAEFATELIVAHKNTAVFGAIGFVLGLVFSNTIRKIPGVGFVLGPLVDAAPILSGLTGAGYGFMRDLDVQRIDKIVREAALKAKAIQMEE